MARTPESMEASVNEQEVRVLVEAFDQELESETKGHAWYHVVVAGEYNRVTLDSVEAEYYAAGWKHVLCQTSSENGERPGLTGLQLWTVKDVHTEHCFIGRCKYGEDAICTVRKVPPTHTMKELY